MNTNKSPPTPNYGSFEVRGIVTGTLNEQRFYSEGDKKNNPWRRIQFGVKVNHNAFVYAELLGIKTPKVKLIYQDPFTKKIDKNQQLLVDFDDRYKVKNNYRIHMPVKLNLTANKLEDKELIPYDAIEYIKNNLKEGDSVLISGSLQIVEYQGKPQEKYIINGIYLTDKIDFDCKNYEQQAYFNQEIVFTGLKYDDYSKKHKISSNIIYKKDNHLDYVPYDFAIKDEYVDELTDYFNHVPYGSTIKIHGHVNISAPMKQIEGRFVVCGAPVKELIVTGGNASSLVKSRYEENDFIIMKQGSPFKEAEKESVEELLPF
ncbi:hypothetical protein [Paenibacillus naphthalenovorans]|uniref:Uncharacterized protein n=1 Tax=Paenibacillus naphthalenovorans TaxID=162209 RepID=A0A0U2KYY5_9BACL|nr:hypothetical protein [Paenibacillus naphthalenovorans]ALS22194.1 hypothetical protein IJ22_18200 [Paenibacillus naphthalenovorans]